MNATLSLIVNDTLREKETRTLSMPRFLRQARIQHESFLCRCGRCEPAVIRLGRLPNGRRCVLFHTEPLSSVVSFSA